MKSRIAVLVEPGRFEIQETDIMPAKDEILVRVSACGLCNWELNHWKGKLGQYPQTLGHEYGGYVAEVGEGVDSFEPGDLVTGLCDQLAGFAEYALMHKSRCFKLDKDFNPQHVIGEPLKCVVTVLRAAAPEAGDVGVVIGCGPMGIWCIQALRGKGLSAVIALDIDDNRLKLAEFYGATHTINTRTTDAVSRIEEISGGHMADFVIEGTGIPEVLNQGMYYLKKGRGRLILMSSHEGPAASGFDFRPAVERSLEIRVAHPGYCIDPSEDMRRAAVLMRQGVFQMDGLINHVFKLEEINKAFEALEKKPAGYMKGIVVP